jgi:hypothetical protein
MLCLTPNNQPNTLISLKPTNTRFSFRSVFQATGKSWHRDWLVNYLTKMSIQGSLKIEVLTRAPRMIPLVILILSSTGCAGSILTTLKQAPAKPAGCTFDIYTSDSEVPKKFEALCIVEAHTGQGMFDDKTVSGAIEEARPKLCECGADAAVLVEGSSKQVSDWLVTIFTPTRDLRGNVKLRGIRFVNEP